MLGLYTLIIGHKSYNMLSILNEKKTLQKELQICVKTLFVFRQKGKRQQQQNKKFKHKTLAGAGN